MFYHFFVLVSKISSLHDLPSIIFHYTFFCTIFHHLFIIALIKNVPKRVTVFWVSSWPFFYQKLLIHTETIFCIKVENPRRTNRREKMK